MVKLTSWWEKFYNLWKEHFQDLNWHSSNIEIKKEKEKKEEDCNKYF